MAMVNSIAMNTGVHASFELSFSPGKCPGVGPMVTIYIYIFFLWICHTVHHSGSTNSHAHQHCKMVPFSPQPLQIIVYRIFDDSYSDWCEAIPNCRFDFHFSNN